MDSSGAGPPVAGPGPAGRWTPGPGAEPEAAERIGEALLGGERRYARIQVSEAAGVDRDRAHQLWMAIGFAEVGDDEAVFTDGDIEALHTWTALLEAFETDTPPGSW